MNRLTVSGALAVGLFVGCQSSAPPKPKTEQAQISGTVTNAGKPIPVKSEVVFFHKGEGLTLASQVDSLGKFSLSAADPRFGIPVGTYEVSVRPPTAAAPAIQPGSADYQKMMVGGGGAQPPTPAESKEIPAKFHKAETSGVVVEAKAGANEINLDLSKL